MLSYPFTSVRDNGEWNHLDDARQQRGGGVVGRKPGFGSCPWKAVGHWADYLSLGGVEVLLSACLLWGYNEVCKSSANCEARQMGAHSVITN